MLDHNEKKPIVADLFFNKDKQDLPIIIFCHGYKGFKDWGAWNLVSETFAKAGFFCLKFNFSHNGGSLEQPIDFPDLEAFSENTYSKEIQDLDTVLNWIFDKENPFKKEMNTDKISVIGHSRGGGIVILKAAKDGRITKIITWAGVSDYEKRFPTGEALQQWKEDGVMFVENSRTKQQMPHKFQFYQTFMENKDSLHIRSAVEQLTIPYLIIHGTADPTVNVFEAKNLHHWYPESELYLVESANHVFGAKHPWEENELPTDLKSVVEKTISFAIL